MRSRHEISLAVVTPKSWDNNQTKRGKFFEDFIGGILKILGYEVLSEVRVIGAEIDLLAKKDNPMENAVVECKFYKDLVSSEVLQKLIGVVTSEEADRGLLFTTSGYGKDAKGMIERLKSKDLGKKFAFYGPQDIIDQAIRVGIARNPKTFEHLLHKENLGRWTLIITPDSVLWQVQIIKDGIPKYYAVIDNELSCLITDFKFDDYKGLDSLFSGLDIYKGVNFTIGALRRESRQKSFASQVLAGSEWDDLRPARPIDFIGRDREIARITTMISERLSEAVIQWQFAKLS